MPSRSRAAAPAIADVRARDSRVVEVVEIQPPQAHDDRKAQARDQHRRQRPRGIGDAKSGDHNRFAKHEDGEQAKALRQVRAPAKAAVRHRQLGDQRRREFERPG